MYKDDFNDKNVKHQIYETSYKTVLCSYIKNQASLY